MFHIKADTIRERTTNGPTYMKGRQLYRQGKVKHLSFDLEKGIILTQVDDARTYDVRIILNGKGELHDANCTCSAFTAYWGFCQHIAATLLHCIDAVAQQNPAGIQVQRRNRSKARDFVAHMEHVIQLAKPDKRPVRLQAILFCSPAACSLPWLSFAVGETQLYPIANVEQFAEAISRDLPLELDKDFSLNPQAHCFLPCDLPLVTMLQEAYDHDYKAVFGTSHASSRDRCFILNSSRFASFLKMAGQLSDCSWQVQNEDCRQPIQIRMANLPINLHLGCKFRQNSLDGCTFELSLYCDQPFLQMTSSRNVYLVGGVFYLPPHENIRLIEPILSTFNLTNLRQLILSREEAIFLISKIRPQLEPVCPIHLDPKLAERLIAEPLRSIVELDYHMAGLTANVSFKYGPVSINPLTSSPPAGDPEQEKLILRDQPQEEQVLQLLGQAGFNRLGPSFRLTDYNDQYRFLDETLNLLAGLAEVNLTPTARKLKILPPPAVQLGLSLEIDQDDLLLRQDFSGLSKTESSAYIQALREKRNFIRTRDGCFRQIRLEDREMLLQLFDLLKLWGIEPGVGESRLPRFRALALESKMARPDTAGLLTADQSVFKMIDILKNPGSLTFRIPLSLNGKLRAYQKTGYLWLCTLDYYGLGGILADDMGLGKTLQTIAYVMMLWQRHKKPSLIIAPTSLVYNWLSEFEKFAPRLKVMVLDGNRQQRIGRIRDLTRHACIITSYSLLRRDIEDIAACSFASCFLDEAQNIKNPKTLNARSVKQVNADRYFALTGTPIENSLTELWSIFDFIMPGYLFTRKSFQNLYEIPVLREGSPQALEDLHRQTAPFILRRMKKDVLKELPDKIETRTICDMTEDQRKIYDAFLISSKNELEKEVSVNGYARSQIYILALLTRLRQICCHPALFLPKYQGGSGKLQLLEELLADCFSAGHRILVFSQFTSMLEMIRERQQDLDPNIFYIDGQVPAEERIAQVQRFNQGEGRLFLISLRAGGTGLNLTGADTVIHFDPWWNPSVEEQATDRAYRIGQENIVQVFKLYTRNSIEEKIYALQQKKQSLIDAVIKPDQNLLSKMTFEEVRSLFDLSPRQDSKPGF